MSKKVFSFVLIILLLFDNICFVCDVAHATDKTGNFQTKKYGYSLLNEKQKRVYDEIYQNMLAFYNSDKDLTNCRPDASQSDSRWIVNAGYTPLTEDLTSDETSTTIVSFIYDNPQFFWISGGFSFSYSKQKVTGYAIFCSETYKDGKYRQKVQRQIDNAVNKYLNDTQDVSDLNKLIKIYRLLCQNATYHFKEDGSVSTEENDINVVGPLLNGQASCLGFSKTFMLLCDKIGFETLLNINNEHSWNMVKIGDNWFQVDATWDSLVYNREKEDNLTFFLITDEECEKTHNKYTPTDIIVVNHWRYDVPSSNFDISKTAGASYKEPFQDSEKIEITVHDNKNKYQLLTNNVVVTPYLEGANYQKYHIQKNNRFSVKSDVTVTNSNGSVQNNFVAKSNCDIYIGGDVTVSSPPAVSENPTPKATTVATEQAVVTSTSLSEFSTISPTSKIEVSAPATKSTADMPTVLPTNGVPITSVPANTPLAELKQTVIPFCSFVSVTFAPIGQMNTIIPTYTETTTVNENTFSPVVSTGPTKQTDNSVVKATQTPITVKVNVSYKGTKKIKNKKIKLTYKITISCSRGITKGKAKKYLPDVKKLTKKKLNKKKIKKVTYKLKKINKKKYVGCIYIYAA